jgi:hypothetical protein
VAYVDSLLGQTVSTKHKGTSMVLTVIKFWDPETDYQALTSSIDDNQALGVKSFDSKQYTKDTVLVALFLHLAFNDWKLIVTQINDAVNLHNNNKSKK